MCLMCCYIIPLIWTKKEGIGSAKLLLGRKRVGRGGDQMVIQSTLVQKMLLIPLIIINGIKENVGLNVK